MMVAACFSLLHNLPLLSLWLDQCSFPLRMMRGKEGSSLAQNTGSTALFLAGHTPLPSSQRRASNPNQWILGGEAKETVTARNLRQQQEQTLEAGFSETTHFNWGEQRLFKPSGNG